jgi:type I restriction enzyme, S subunit
LSGIPFITANCIINNRISLDKCQYLTEDWLRKLRIGFTKENDVILSHKGTIGLCAIIPLGVKNMILSPQTTYYRPSYAISPEFLFYVFQSQNFQGQLSQLGKQSTRDYVGITAQRELVIPYMSISEQKKIAYILSSIDLLIQIQINQKRSQERLKKSLMQKLLTGKIRVKV